MATRLVEGLVRGTRRVLEGADAWMNRIYGSRFNPFYHSGALVVALFLVLLVTGLYLLLFYRVGAPYESVQRINEQIWLGRWIRALHRYATVASMIAIAVHTFRMFAQRRTWGPRAMAWITGVILLGIFMVCGWTGYVMVWDVQGQVLAQEAARVLDGLPLFAEPVVRAFSGEQPIPEAFFFMNLFLHVALPVGLALMLWLHVARVRRPVLLPPRPVLWGTVGLLTGAAVLWPAALGPQADLFRVPERAPYDLFFSFWIPIVQVVPTWAAWVAIVVLGGVFFAVPWLVRPRDLSTRQPSVVNERHCTGCEQCAIDCPYEAISMVRAKDGRATLVARVDPNLCVSCGICAGSCAPMGVGPPGRTGRDQLAEARAFSRQNRPGPRDVVVISCTQGGGGVRASADGTFDGSPVFPVRCAGNLHTSTIEYFVRSGAAGVMVVACPERDCWNREGSKWLEQRMYHDREAELQERVDRRRVRLVEAGGGERPIAAAALATFREELDALEAGSAEEALDLIALCDRPEEDE